LDDQIKKNELGEYVACMGEGEVYIGFWWGNLKERDHLDNPGIDGRIILRWTFSKWKGERGAQTGLMSLRIGTGGGDL